MVLNRQAIKFFEDRGIEEETAIRFGISTVNIADMRGRTVVAFPYFEHDVTVNEKFRMLPKERFWQHSGRKKIFWNVDILEDPMLEKGQALVITEGEIDALTAIQCNYPWAVSVPDGAPPENSKSEIESGSDEQDGRFSFLWNARERLKAIKRFILAVDNDGPGQRLREELIRRLSASRCSFVEYPMGCKDLNDVLVKHGKDAVMTVLQTAKPCPVKGLYRLEDFPDEGPLQTFGTGWSTLDRHLRLVLGEFMVVTGIPQHGKSSFMLHLLANVVRLHDWRVAIFSPEMRVVPIIRDRLRSIRTGKAPDLASPETNAWINDRFLFIGAHPTNKSDDEDFNLNWILDKATEAVLRDGIRILLIDPWNEIEHARLKDESLTEYIARSVRAIKRFAMAYNVIAIVVAHPTKMPTRQDGTFAPPTLYDISDSAHWYNKSDHGIVVYRKPTGGSQIHVVKSRFDEAGEPGHVEMTFDPITHRFHLLAKEPA